METATTTAESVAYTIDTCYSRTIGVQYLSMAKMVQYLVLAKIVQYLFLATMVVTGSSTKATSNNKRYHYTTKPYI